MGVAPTGHATGLETRVVELEAELKALHDRLTAIEDRLDE